MIYSRITPTTVFFVALLCSVVAAESTTGSSSKCPISTRGIMAYQDACGVLTYRLVIPTEADYMYRHGLVVTCAVSSCQELCDHANAFA
jgi:hypothetical protein